MNRRPIQVLEPSVAERIAAGEVIERPASVVKELIENALDAGATEIAVILEDGGKSLIEVTDNGHGMNAEDLQLAVLRHATSKLSTIDDLEKIRTLGFRGEALASVAAVADLSIVSRSTESDAKAYEFRSGWQAPKPVTFGHFLNTSHGTRIQARGLFAQVPARLKFLKSQGAEVSQVREWMERLALTHPEAGFRLVSNDRPIISFRPQSEVDRVRIILGEGDDFPVVTEQIDSATLEFPLKLRVHWLQGLSSPQSRKVVQVVNGRALRDRMLQQALLSAFRQALLPGQFPAVALYLEIAPSELDVNVHPTKTEIRFLDSRKVFHTVDSLVRMMIEKRGAPSFASGPVRTPFTTPLHGERGSLVSAEEYVPKPSGSSPDHSAPSPSAFWQARDSDPALTAFPRNPNEVPQHSPTHQDSLFGAGSSAAKAANPIGDGRWVGIIFNTYLIYDCGHELVLIDQHAAHERIRYEQLRKRIFTRNDAPGVVPNTQSLLLPEVVHFPAEFRGPVEERLPLLTRMGFETEIFGNDSLLFRGIPVEWGNQDLKHRLKNLVDRLIHLELSVENPEIKVSAQSLPPGRALLPAILMDERLFETLASEACHSAIRAGDALEPAEAHQMMEDLFRCDHPWNCPHGRPTVVRVPPARFEEWFQRRV